MSAIPKHKGNENLRANIKSKMAELRLEIESAKRKKTGRSKGFTVEREGVAQIALIGPPNSGKSSLLATLTNAKPVIAAYPYTTQHPTPGMMAFKDLQFQLLELPALRETDPDGGAENLRIWELCRRADAIGIVIDLTTDPIRQLEWVLSEMKNARLLFERKGGRVEIIRGKGSGGVQMAQSGTLRGCTLGDVRKLLNQYGIHSAIVRIYGEVGLEEVEEAIWGTVAIFKPSIIVANKLDSSSAKENIRKLSEYSGPKPALIAVSCETREGLEQVGDALLRALEIIRVYTKEPLDEEPSPEPFVLPRGSRAIELAKQIHSGLAQNFAYARVWGPSSKFGGERVGENHVLEDGDVIEIHTK